MYLDQNEKMDLSFVNVYINLAVILHNTVAD